MARSKALTKAEKAAAITDLKGALKIARQPLDAANAALKEADKAHGAALKGTAKTLKAKSAAEAKVAKYTKVHYVGTMKIQDKIAAIEAAPLIVVGKVKAEKVAKVAPAVKKVADATIAKAKKAPAKATAELL